MRELFESQTVGHVVLKTDTHANEAGTAAPARGTRRNLECQHPSAGSTHD